MIGRKSLCFVFFIITSKLREPLGTDQSRNGYALLPRPASKSYLPYDTLESVLVPLDGLGLIDSV